ncbi:MAG TPA: CcmD family protein [Anaerolineae bacterium]|nr:CcmD family protein [Anaerolineae bacterium]HNU04414.1 CcmD family protein [Anaerolineae bacterium]
MSYLVLGMIIFWFATFAFVWSISRRQNKLEEEVAVLQEVVDKSADASV